MRAVPGHCGGTGVRSRRVDGTGAGAAAQGTERAGDGSDPAGEAAAEILKNDPTLSSPEFATLRAKLARAFSASETTMN